MAHADLESSTPEAGADVESAPSEVVLTFSGELGPDSAFVVTDAAGGTVGEGGLDLDVAVRNVLSGSVDITQPGIYTVSWSAVSIDGHAEEGSFEFGFQSDAAAAAGAPPDDAGSPDTAMPASGAPGAPGALSAAGLALLAAGMVVAGRRALVVHRA